VSLVPIVLIIALGLAIWVTMRKLRDRQVSKDRERTLRICTNCHAEYETEKKFCKNCGSPLQPAKEKNPHGSQK
jgi:rRNA maturation endonuclease Nob1